jgi:transcriptional regulator of acetoin/glycerol metabolism
MPQNPWLAIDAATSPMVRATQLRHSWEHFLGDGRLEAVRAPIADSWQRSYAAGVDPSAGQVAPALADADETSARWQVHPLATAAALILDCLGPVAAEAGQLIVVSDAEGMLLWIDGPPGVRRDAAESMNFTEGAGWSEIGAGTNAIGTALAADHAVQVFAAEHFNEVVQEWTCSAAPIHDPDTGRLLGIVDLTGKMGTVHPYSFGCAVATAQAVESHLRWRMGERDARLRARYEHRIASSGPRASLVTPSGRVISGDEAVRWIGADRVAVPTGGGELTLPSGVCAVADPVGHEEAFVVRADDRRRAAPRRPRSRSIRRPR